jgi:hypothetical protein
MPPPHSPLESDGLSRRVEMQSLARRAAGMSADQIALEDLL